MFLFKHSLISFRYYCFSFKRLFLGVALTGRCLLAQGKLSLARLIPLTETRVFPQLAVHCLLRPLSKSILKTYLWAGYEDTIQIFFFLFPFCSKIVFQRSWRWPWDWGSGSEYVCVTQIYITQHHFAEIYVDVPLFTCPGSGSYHSWDSLISEQLLPLFQAEHRDS